MEQNNFVIQWSMQAFIYTFYQILFKSLNICCFTLTKFTSNKNHKLVILTILIVLVLIIVA